MSRVIKFRAWDGKQMIYQDENGYFNNVKHPMYSRLQSMQLFGTMQVAEMMQFTGITDVNGNEIYEGDCDAVGNVVEFVNGSWCLNGDRPLTSRFIKAGNIYEQKELL